LLAFTALLSSIFGVLLMDFAAVVFGVLLAAVAAFFADEVVLTAFTIEVVPLIVPLAATPPAIFSSHFGA
jgi:hypothetical protein